MERSTAKKRQSPPSSPSNSRLRSLTNDGIISQRHQSGHPRGGGGGQRRRRRRRRIKPQLLPPGKMVTGLFALCASLLWIISIMFFSLRLDRGTENNYGMWNSHNYYSENDKEFTLQRFSGVTGGSGSGLFSNNYSSSVNAAMSWQLPPHSWQLWPDDSIHPDYLKDFLTKCHGQNCHLTPPAVGAGADKTRVILIRPPGVFGSLVQEFVQVMIHTLNNNVNTNINQPQRLEASTKKRTRFVLEIFRYPPSSSFLKRLGNEATTTVKLIRVVTSPILLEAMDLALTVAIAASKNDGDKPGRILTSWNEVEQVVRWLVQWQAAVNLMVEHIPATLIMTLQSTLLIPQKNEQTLVDFLLGDHAQDDDDQTATTAATSSSRIPPVPRDDLAKRALQRIDACTELASRTAAAAYWRNFNTANNNNGGFQSLHETVQEWISQEIKRVKSWSTAAAKPGDTTTTSPFLQQVYALLHEQDVVVCETYPHLCQHQKVML